MAMTLEEYQTKAIIRNFLAKQGYPTYSRLIRDFDLHLTSDPNVVAYMIPGQGVIVLNRGLASLEQVSTIVRHEILHEYLNHAQRFIDHLGQTKYDQRTSGEHQNMNIAGDYDISNRGYTVADKENVRNIRFKNGVTLKGLVTEDEHPDWTKLSVEEMYDRLTDEMEKEKEEAADDMEDSQDSSEGSEADGEQIGGEQQGNTSSSSSSGSQSNQSSSTSSADGDSTPQNDGDNGGGSGDSENGSDSKVEYTAEYARGWEEVMREYAEGRLRV